MLFKKISFITTAVIVFLAMILAVLKRFVWSGFSYVVLPLLSLLMLLWMAYFIYEYFTDFKKELEEEYSHFKANKANKTQTTFDEDDEYALRREFNRSTIKQKLLKWSVIVIFVAIAVGLVISMFYIH